MEKGIWNMLYEKHNSAPEKQIVFIMIPNGKCWHYLPVKKLSAWLKEINSKHSGISFCLNRLHSSRTSLNLIKKYGIVES